MSAEVQYADRFRQLLLFEGMAFNNIYPTDIDAITEYHNRLFIVMEVKGEGVQLPYGQKTALTRMVDALQGPEKDAVLFVCRHNVADNKQPVVLKDTTVEEAYWKGKWYKIKKKTAGEAWLYALRHSKKEEKEAENE